MRITESRLRRVIRSMIKESRIDEMIDMMNFGTVDELGPSGTLSYILEQPLPQSEELMIKEINKILRLCNIESEHMTHALGFWSFVVGGLGMMRGALGTYVGASTAPQAFLIGATSLGVFIAAVLYDNLYGNQMTLQNYLKMI